MNGLQIVANLQARGINREMLCPCCDKELEPITHALIRCDIAKRVWSCWEGCPVNMLMIQWDVSDTELEILATKTTRDFRLGVFFVTSWSIWYNRNQVVFESTCQISH